MKHKDFFKNYSDLFTSGAVDSISELYVFPMIFFAEDGQSICFSSEEFNDNSHKLIELYNKLGISDVEFDLVSEQTLSSHLSLISIKWYFKSKNTLVYDCITRYVLLMTSAGIKIKAVFVVDETTKLKKLFN